MPGSLADRGVQPTEFSTILDRFRETVALRARHEAVRYFDASLSYADIDALSDGFAGWLAQRGVGPGDRIGILLQNVPHMLVANIAAWKLGAIPVPGNPMYRARELAAIFADYAPSAIVCHDEHVGDVAAALDEIGLPSLPVTTAAAGDFQTVDDPRLIPATSVGTNLYEDFMACCARGAENSQPFRTVRASDVAFLLYTSGTTGKPKGATLTHATLAFTTEVGIVALEIDKKSRILGLAPLFHITGYVLHMAVALATGCSLSLNYRFHPEGVLDVIRDYRPTYTIAAITAFNALMNTPGSCREDFASFVRISTGGAPMAPALQDELRARWGINVLPAYGMTETCAPALLPPPGTVNVPNDSKTGVLAVGMPVPGTEARIVDAEGRTLAPGEHGEIWMRGPHIMRGYWNKAAETAETMHDGWLKSGDIGFMDASGWFYVVDRLKNMINASGFKVWPREVEDVLQAHPAIREVAVVGVFDPYRGETVRAYVSLVPGEAAPGNDVLIGHCRERLAAYKVPRTIITLAELPKTPTGKIQHSTLRERP